MVLQQQQRRWWLDQAQLSSMCLSLCCRRPVPLFLPCTLLSRFLAFWDPTALLNPPTTVCHCAPPPHTQLHAQVTTAIKPQDNSLLEGLYKSGGNYCTQVGAEVACRVCVPDTVAVVHAVDAVRYSDINCWVLGGLFSWRLPAASGSDVSA